MNQFVFASPTISRPHPHAHTSRSRRETDVGVPTTRPGRQNPVTGLACRSIVEVESLADTDQ